jgi:putative radical SAM enzyme (TIGR03279 family)
VGRAHEAPENHRDEVAPAVTGLDPEGEAALAGVRVGDRLEAVDGEPVRDVLEFTFLTSGEPTRLTFSRGDDRYDVDLEGLGPTGIEFEQELFDGLRRCNNSCVFCFVHQLPAKVVRRSLLTKDEDYRLSFLHGGYVTMGNFTEDDYERIIDMRLSPLYVSVHATDLAVRRQMLGNPKAPDVLDGLRRLRDNGIEFYGQVVLVPGYNTGEVLRRTLHELGEFPNMRSTAVVPVGLTDFRDRLPELRELTREEAAEAVDLVHAARVADQDPRGPRFYAADELFAAAERPCPQAAYYDEAYELREDGVGMVRSFEDGFRRLAEEAWPTAHSPAPARPARVAVVTGVAAARHFERFLMPRLRRAEGLAPELVVVENDFFGHGIQVAGLLTGQDILKAVNARGRFDRVLVGEHAFQPGGDIMLDGTTLSDLQSGTGADVRRVADDPRSLVEAALGLALPGAPDDETRYAAARVGIAGLGAMEAMEV